MANLTRAEFIQKYGNTFGANAASEVAGMDVGSYYDNYLANGAKGGVQTGGWDGSGEVVPIQWGGGRYSDSNPTFDAWSNVDPHPESNRGNGLDEAWKAVGRPLAVMAAMYTGVNALGGLLGGETLGATATPVTSSSVTGTSLAPLASQAPNAGMTLAEQMASYGAGGGGVTGGLATDTVGGFTGAAGGDLIGSAAGGAGSASGLLSGLKDYAPLIGAGLGALAGQDTTTSSSKDPWGPAQQYLKDNLAQNAAMQKYYQANPFSTEQKSAYQGIFDANANNMANAPIMQANANNFLQSNRGVMPQMQGLLSGTKATPIDWSKYANIGVK
jgi:hypothetical protein